MKRTVPLTRAPFRRNLARVLGAILGPLVGSYMGLVVTPVVVLSALFPLAWEDHPGTLSLIPLGIAGGFIFEVIAGALVGFLLGPRIEKRLDAR